MSDQQLSETKRIPIDGVKVGQRFRKDLGDIKGLAKSIQELGLLQPIVVSETFELVAGERRLEACKSLGWTEIPANIINLADIVRGEFDENAIRKDFTVSEMVAIKRHLEPVERQAAEERQRAGTPAAESAKGRATDRISAAIGISRDTLGKAEAIVEAAEKNPEEFEEIKEKVDRKEMSVNEAHQKVTGKSKKKKDPTIQKFKLNREQRPIVIEALQEDEREGMEESDIWIEGNRVIGTGRELEITT